MLEVCWWYFMIVTAFMALSEAMNYRELYESSRELWESKAESQFLSDSFFEIAMVATIVLNILLAWAIVPATIATMIYKKVFLRGRLD